MNNGLWLSDPTILLISASVFAAVSGLPVALRLFSPSAAQRLSSALISAASIIGLYGAICALLTRSVAVYQLTWPLPFGLHQFGLDPLSAVFVIPVLIVACCCSIYAISYWPASENSENIRKLTLFFGLLVSAMLWVLLARSAAVFLFAWEIMALAAYFILTTSDEEPEVRKAGILYLICTHIGTLTLFAFFSILKVSTGSFALPAQASIHGATGLATVLFLLSLLGFGLKAGIMPFHIWLPTAHANAPSHVSAIMSGVILKIGIYGLLRSLSFFTAIPLWWGITLLALGVVSGVAGVAFAIGQHDLKRLLAYHSIENIGIICIGIGVGLIGVTNGSNTLVLLGTGGALLHVINHALFKALLFLGAGSIIHAIGTREIDRMGGLIKSMPRTAILFLIGAVAICGLPPLNGFVSELLIYLGLFNAAINGSGAAAAALSAPFLALVGGLALACFVKVFGVVFSGVPRSPEAASAKEAGISMIFPMVLLASVCIAIGLFPLIISPILDSAVSSWYMGAEALHILNLAPLPWLSFLAIALILLIVMLYFLNRRSASAPSAETWGCGYLAPTPRMQYSSSSFAEMLVGLFSGILRPSGHLPLISGSLPKSSRFESHVPETVLERLYLPFLNWSNSKLAPLRQIQHGQLNLYILYTLVTLIALLSFSFY